MPTATKLEDYPIAFILSALFIVAMFTFAVGIGNNYGFADNLFSSDQYNYSEMAVELNSTNQLAPTWLNSFREDSPAIATGILILFSVWGSIQNIIGLTYTLLQLLSSGIFNVLGIPPLVLGVVVTIIILLLILLGWKKIKLGV